MYRSTCFNYIRCWLFRTCFLSIACKSSGPSISFHGFNCGAGTKFPDQMKGTEQLNSHDMLLSNEETFRFEHVTVAGDVGRSILTSLSSLSLQYRHIGNGQLSHSRECESPFCCTLWFSDIYRENSLKIGGGWGTKIWILVDATCFLGLIIKCVMRNLVSVCCLEKPCLYEVIRISAEHCKIPEHPTLSYYFSC